MPQNATAKRSSLFIIWGFLQTKLGATATENGVKLRKKPQQAKPCDGFLPIPRRNPGHMIRIPIQEGGNKNLI